MTQPPTSAAGRSSWARRVARLRVPLGFVFGAVCLGLARPTPGSVLAGGLIAAAGEAIRVWASGHLEKGREVTTSGPYRWTRHPLYMGSSLMGLGLVVASLRLEVVVLVVLYVAVTMPAAIRSEEAFLTDAFGEAYPRYRAGRLAVEVRRFSWRRAAANREYRAAGGLAVVILLLALKALWV